jgi:hypothetical protein
MGIHWTWKCFFRKPQCARIRAIDPITGNDFGTNLTIVFGPLMFFRWSD